MITKKQKHDLQIAVTRLELALRKALKKKKKDILIDRRARAYVEALRKRYLLKEKTILMFRTAHLLPDYTRLLNDFNKVLDGDLT